jgi:outer membrane protein
MQDELNVANAFLQVLFFKENLKVQLEQLELTKTMLKVSRAGSIPRVICGRKSYCSIKQSKNVITAENTLLISKLSLLTEDFESFDVC